MSIRCEIILGWGATPEQLTALGFALWRWCTRPGGVGVYRLLNSQFLADLIAGKFPAASQGLRYSEKRGVYLRVQDEVSPDRQAAIAGLRGVLLASGVVDVLIDGTSWDLTK
jgi:hypothetical protein